MPTLQDWLAAQQRIEQQGLPQDTALSVPLTPYQRFMQGVGGQWQKNLEGLPVVGPLFTPPQSGAVPQEGVEAVPFGSLSDPVSQAAFLLAPGVQRGLTTAGRTAQEALLYGRGGTPLRDVGQYRLGERGAVGQKALQSLQQGPPEAGGVMPDPDDLSRFTHWRYGAPPASGRSLNARDDMAEMGVSAFPRDIAQLSPQAVRSAMGIQNRPLYLLRGQVVGHGADAEPLVQVEESLRAPTGWTVETPWGTVRQAGTPAEEFASAADLWGQSVPRGATRMEIYDNAGEQVTTYHLTPEGLGQQNWGAYSFARRGVQAKDFPETAGKVIFRNQAGKDITPTGGAQ